MSDALTTVEQLLCSRSGKFERKIWHVPALTNSPTTAVVFLDGELYRERVRAGEVVDQLQRDGTLPPVASVFVSYGDAAARHADLTCNLDFAAFVAGDVYDVMREQLPSLHRIVLAGLSLSGLQAAFIATRYPERFAAVICQSPSFWWDDARFARELVPAIPSAPPLWVSVGDRETDTNVAHQPSGLFQKLSQIEGCAVVCTVLREQGYHVSSRTFAGGHDPNCWREDLFHALRWACGDLA